MPALVACEEEPAGGALAGPFWDAFCEEVDAECAELGLNAREISFKGGKLNVLAGGGGSEKLEALNRHLSAYIDAQDEDDSLPAFLLEVSSPGLSATLTTDLDFTAFKGFPVVATTTEPFKSKTRWEGTLVGRDEEFLSLNLKGRSQRIPIGIIDEVCLPAAKREAGDVS